MSEEDFLKKYNLKKAENTKDYQIDNETLIKDLKEQVEYVDQWRKEYLYRIDKAIEFIEKEHNEYNREFDSYQIWLEELLNILKGEE